MLLIQAVKSIIGEVFDDVSFEEFEEDSNVSQLCSNSYILASSRPRPAFHRLQYGKAGRAWYLFSREHDVIGKLQKFAELTDCVSHIFNQLRAQRSVCKTIASR